jgi:hypothetical protein
MATSDEVAQAFTAWTTVHRQLIDAEQQLSLLGSGVNVALRTAAQARVQQLRSESDRLLAEANLMLRQFEASKPR